MAWCRLVSLCLFRSRNRIQYFYFFKCEIVSYLLVCCQLLSYLCYNIQEDKILITLEMCC